MAEAPGKDSQKLKILLVDLTQRRNQSDLSTLLALSGQVQRVTEDDELVEAIAAFAPQVLCFQYDFPDMPRLSLLQVTKLSEPSIPIILVTEQHSAAFALWALRSRVWDYFVKPFAAADLLTSLEQIARIVHGPSQQPSRKPILPRRSVPLEFRFSSFSSAEKDIRKAIQFIEDNFQEDLLQPEVAQACSMSPSQFSRNFKQIMGLTFQDFLVRKRLTEAVRLLREAEISVAEVCYSVGFRDLSHFISTFHKHLGTTPARYRTDLEAVCASLLPFDPAARKSYLPSAKHS